MGLLRTLLLGRQHGIRARIRRRITALLGGPDREPVRPVDPEPSPAPSFESRVPEPPKDVVPPPGFEVVLHVDALPPGQLKEVIVGGKAIAVANVGGEFYATTNSCPHAESPLAEGDLDGAKLTCSGHGWMYDVTTGVCLTNPDVHLATYETRVVEKAVCVRV
jgi:nitrite reductase/ring-hydroxylating ferredoxin subunit